VTLSPAPALPRTANDRLKDAFELHLALSFIAAVLLHALVFSAWPTMEVPAWKAQDQAFDVIRMDAVELPPEPAPLSLPAVPIPSLTVPGDVTMEAPDWSDPRILPEPRPADPVAQAERADPFVVVTSPPALLNPEDVERALAREYPPTLRDAGLGGTVTLLVHVGPDGSVLEVRTDGRSGMESLDAAALRVADVFRFRAAKNRDRAVAVWITLPVTFRVR